jgi:hypothetical protein
MQGFAQLLADIREEEFGVLESIEAERQEQIRTGGDSLYCARLFRRRSAGSSPA